MVAMRTKIHECIKYCSKEGGRNPSVLAKAINAIVAAVYLDSGGDKIVTLQVMLNLGLVSVETRRTHCVP